MKHGIGLLLAGIVWIIIQADLPATAQNKSPFGYSVEFDVKFGAGKVAPNGKLIDRDLLMDVYTPSSGNADYTRKDEVSTGPYPAVVYVHGGAHHRGGRRLAPFRLEAAVHSRPEDYARLLAPMGYVVFVVEYRLATENPEPTLKPGEAGLRVDVNSYITPIVFEATVRARTAMGLPRLENNDKGRLFLWKAGLAGAEDVNKAVEFVASNAKRFNIDPSRIAVGGHSAGGGIALNVGLGFRAPVAAIFPLSGPDVLFDHAAIAKHSDLPPTLLMYSQFDEHTQLGQLPDIISLLRQAKVDYQLAWVPGFAHFYPHNAVSLGNDGTRMSVGDRIVAFLNRHLKMK